MGLYFTPEEDKTILNCIAESIVLNKNILSGIKTAAKLLGRTPKSIKCRYYDKLRNTQEIVAGPKPTMQEAIAEMVQEKGLRHVEKEDLTKIAKKTGEHYHSVLSTWGGIWSSVRTLEQDKHKDCYWCKARTITQMRANGLTYEEIGKRLQMNHATVANLHKAYRLFPNHRDTLPISCYIAIARADTVEPPEEWAAFAEENHLSVRALQEALKMPLQTAKEKYRKQEKPSEVHLQEPFPGVKDAQQKIASLYTTIYGLQQDVKGLSTLVNSLRKEKAVLQEDLRKQHAKAVSLLKEAHVREKALLSLLKAVAEEAGVPARWKRAADVFADDANKLVKAVRGIKKLNAVYLTMLKNKNVKKAAKKGA